MTIDSTTTASATGSPSINTNDQGGGSGSSASTGNRGARAFFVGLFAVLAAALIASASAGIWLRDTVLHTDNWVQAVGSLPEDPRVADAVAGFVAGEVISVTNAESEIQQVLQPIAGDDAGLLAGPITSAVEDFIHSTADEVIQTPEFRQVWEDVNRISHEEAVLVLRGNGDAVTSANGQVQLNLLPMVNGVIREVSADASQLFGTDVDIPELSATDLQVPDEARATLEQELGVSLPEDFGVVTVYDDNRLGEVQLAVRWIDDLLVVSAIAAVVVALAAIGLSHTRRRTVAMLGTLVAAFAAVLFIAADVIERDVVNEISDESAREATRAAVDVALLRGLEGHLALVAGVALMVTLIAWLIGPGKSAVAIRSAFSPGSEMARTVRRNEPALQTAGAVVAFVTLVALNHVTWGRFFAVVVALVIYLMVVRALSATGGDESTDATDESTPIPSAGRSPTNDPVTISLPPILQKETTQ